MHFKNGEHPQEKHQGQLLPETIHFQELNMLKNIMGVKHWYRPSRVVFIAALTVTSSATHAADWRMVIASTDLVVSVDASNFRRDGPQLRFPATLHWQDAKTKAVTGDLSNYDFDCAGRRVQTEQLFEFRPDGSKVPSSEEKKGYVAIPQNSIAEVFLDRMCDRKNEGNKMNGVAVSVPPDMAAKSVFGLLKLGLDSDQASQLATVKYWDDESLVRWLDSFKVPKAKQAAFFNVLASQTVRTPPPPPPIVPLPSAVATGRVGKHSYSAQEIGAGLWLRADGTFRYGLTVGSLDETAAGRWTAKGNRVQLTNEPRPVPPTVTAGPTRLAPGAPLSINLRTPGGGAVPGVDFFVEFDAGDALTSYTQAASWVLPAGEKRPPRFVTFAWPSYGLRPARFPIDINTANALNFVFTPNDFGVIDLTGLVVEADAKSLTLQRDGGAMRFTKTSQ